MFQWTLAILLMLPLTGFGRELSDGPPATAPSTQPTLEELRAEQRKRFVENVQNLSTLPPKPMDQVARLTVVEGMLLIECLSPPTDGIHRIEITDQPGVATLNVVEDNKTAARWFSFEHVSFNLPDAIYGNISLNAREDGGQLAFEVLGVKENLMVQLLEDFRQTDEPEARVKLYVQRFDAQNEDILGKTTIAAARFDSLLNEHRAPMARYVIAPLLPRGLHRSLLAPPAARAWQVLGDSVPTPPEVQTQLQELLKRLDSDEFADRQKAEADLRQLGPKGASALRRIDRSGLSAEQLRAVEGASAEYSQLDEKSTLESRQDPLFLAGVLYGDESSLWPAAAERLASAVPGSVPVDPTGQPATVRAAADAALRRYIQQLPPDPVEPKN